MDIEVGRIERAASVVRETFGANVTHVNYEEVAVLTITRPGEKGAAVLRLPRELFEDNDDDQIARWLGEMRLRVRPGDSMVLRSDGTLAPFPAPCAP